MTIAVAVSFGQGIMFVPEATWTAELFQGRLRYSGSSLGFEIGAALSGGLTPMAASALLLWTGATWSISLYLTALAVVTLAATLAAPETARHPLLRDDSPHAGRETLGRSEGYAGLFGRRADAMISACGRANCSIFTLHRLPPRQ